MCPAKLNLSGLPPEELERLAETRVHRAINDAIARGFDPPQSPDRILPGRNGDGGGEDAAGDGPADDAEVSSAGRDASTGRFTGNNPGRPKGALNKSTIFLRRLMDGHSENVARNLITLALAGDAQALRICGMRLMPARRDHHVHVDLPPIVTAHDAMLAAGKITEWVTQGQLTPGEAQKLSTVIENQRRAIETAYLERKLLQAEVHAVAIEGPSD